MPVEIIKIIAFLSVIILNFSLGSLVLRRNPRNIVNQVFFLLQITFSLWGLSLLLYEYPIIFSHFFWIRATYIMVIGFVVLVFLFSFIFPRTAFQRVWPWAILTSFIYIAVSTLLLFFTNLWVIDVVTIPGKGIETILGPYYLWWYGFDWLITAWAGINFFIKSRQATSSGKLQMQYFWIGFASFGVSVGVFDVIIPVFWGTTRYFYLGAISNVFFSGAVAYIIIKHRFLDIRIALQETLIFLITGVLTGIVASVGAIIYWFAVGVNIRPGVFIVTFGVGFTFVLLHGRLLKLAKIIVANIFSQSIYDYQQVVKDLSHRFSIIIDLEQLAEVIIDTLTKALRVNRVGVLVWDSIEKSYQLEKSVGFDRHNDIFTIRHDFLATYLERHPQIIVLEELQRQIEEIKDITEKRLLEEISDRMRQIQASLIIPIINAGKLIGLVVLGDKKSGDPYTVQDTNILNTIANQASIAFENAMLYSQLSNLNQNLLKKVDEETAELQQKNQELKTANEELKSLDKMKDQLVAVTSHELKTPLSIAQNYLWMVINQAASQTKLDEKDRLRLRKSFSNLQNLTRLIDDILSVSKIEGGKLEIHPEIVHSEAVVNEVIEELKLKADQRGLTLSFAKPAKKLTIYTDPLRLKEVLTNLLSNAIKYTDKGGATVDLEKKDGQAVFSVTDTGRGIAAEHLDNIFKKFYREDTSLTASSAQAGGTGLGLYITKSILDLMQGKIWVKSKLGKGSVFSFSLPVKIPIAKARSKVLKKTFKGVYYRKE